MCDYVCSWNPGYFIYRFFSPLFFGQRGDLAVVLCPTTAVVHHYLFLWCVSMTRHHCQLPKSPLRSPSLPPLARNAHVDSGFHWHPSGPHPCPPNWRVGWGPGDGRRFGTEKTCCRVEGCTGDEVAKHFSDFTLRENSDAEWEPSQKNPKVGAVSCHIYSAVVHFPQGKFPPKVSNALCLPSLQTAPMALPLRCGIGPRVGTPGEIPGRVKTGVMF